MLDTHWMMSAMLGDGLIFRLHLTPGENPRTEAHAFSYWNDDMAYNGFHVIYQHDEATRMGIKPIEYSWLPSDCNMWSDYFEAQSEYWPTPWHLSKQTVCTIGTKASNTRRISPGNPQVLPHLARFQTAAILTDSSQFEGHSSGISLEIVSRRLEGLIRGIGRNWRQLIDQS